MTGDNPPFHADGAANRAQFRAKDYEDKAHSLIQEVMNGTGLTTEYLDEMDEDELRDLAITLQVLYKATREAWELRVTTLRNTFKDAGDAT